jgi:hypothetical protein
MDTDKLNVLLYGYDRGEVSIQELKVAFKEFLESEQALFDLDEEEG